MVKIYLTTGTLLAGLLIGNVAAIAQQTPMSAAHQQALVAKDPAACGKAVDNIWLRIQNDTAIYTRATVSAWLQTAQNAAKNGDEQTCWYWYDRAQNRP